MISHCSHRPASVLRKRMVEDVIRRGLSRRRIRLGLSVWLVPRQHGVAPNQVFSWGCCTPRDRCCGHRSGRRGWLH